MSINRMFPPSQRRTAVARALFYELDMTYEQIGKYLGLHKTSVQHLIKTGSTNSIANRLRSKHTKFTINI